MHFLLFTNLENAQCPLSKLIHQFKVYGSLNGVQASSERK